MSTVANMTDELRLMLGLHAQASKHPDATYRALIDVLTGQAGLRQAARARGISTSFLCDSLKRFREHAAAACRMAQIDERTLVVASDQIDEEDEDREDSS